MNYLTPHRIEKRRRARARRTGENPAALYALGSHFEQSAVVVSDTIHESWIKRALAWLGSALVDLARVLGRRR
jgi:hypothetical protein